MPVLQLLAVAFMLVIKASYGLDISNLTYTTSIEISDSPSSIQPTDPTNLSAHLARASDSDLQEGSTKFDSTTLLYDYYEMEDSEIVPSSSTVQTSNFATWQTSPLSVDDENIANTTPVNVLSSSSEPDLINSYYLIKDKEVTGTDNTNSLILQESINTYEDPNLGNINTSENSMSEIFDTSVDSISESFYTTEHPVSESKSTSSSTEIYSSHETYLFSENESSKNMTNVSETLNVNNYSEVEYVSQVYSQNESYTPQKQFTISEQTEIIPESQSVTESSRTESSMLESSPSSSIFATDKTLLSSKRDILQHVQKIFTLPSSMTMDEITQAWETRFNATPSTELDINYSYSDEEESDSASSPEDLSDITIFSTSENTTSIMNPEEENLSSGGDFVTVPVWIHKLTAKRNFSDDDNGKAVIILTQLMNPMSTRARKPQNPTTETSRDFSESPVATDDTNNKLPIKIGISSNETKSTDMHPVNSNKRLFVKSANSLNERERKLYPVTVVFDSNMSIAEWFSKYDDNYKKQVLETLNNCIELKKRNQTFQVKDVLYFTSSPFTNGNDFSVRMVVLDPLAKKRNVYIAGKILVECIEKDRRAYEALVKSIVNIFVGIPQEEGERKSSKVIFASALAILTIVAICLIVVIITIFHKTCERRINKPVDKSHNQKSEGHDLVSDRECTASEEITDLEEISTGQSAEGVSRNGEMRGPDEHGTWVVQLSDIHDTRL